MTMIQLGGSVGRGGANRTEDLRAVQQLLVANVDRLQPLKMTVSGRMDTATVHAIEEFQRRIVGLAQPDGRVDPGGRTLALLNKGAGSREPTVELPWVAAAWREIGVREIPGNRHNPRILQYLSSLPDLAGRPAAARDETAWCAAFVNWCLQQAGLPTGNVYGANAMARSWLRYGAPLKTPSYGSIAIVYHRPDPTTAGTTSSGYHVAFCTRWTPNSITLLGGNQQNQVIERTYRNYWSLQGCRFPE